PPPGAQPAAGHPADLLSGGLAGAGPCKDVRDTNTIQRRGAWERSPFPVLFHKAVYKSGKSAYNKGKYCDGKKYPPAWAPERRGRRLKPPSAWMRGNASRSRRGEIPARREPLSSPRAGGPSPSESEVEPRVASPSQTCVRLRGLFYF